MLKRRALRRKQLGAVFRYPHIVLEANTELITDVDPGLIAEGHTGLQFQGIAAHEIRPFVTVHSNTVANTVSEKVVVWPEARLLNYFASRCIYSLALDTRFGCA